MNYEEFVADKVRSLEKEYGFEVTPDEVHPDLFPHQNEIVRWACKGGRRAIFAAFGLGKSVMQLETIRLTLAKHGGGRGLIICPLGVRIEFTADARMLGLDTKFIRRTSEIAAFAFSKAYCAWPVHPKAMDYVLANRRAGGSPDDLSDWFDRLQADYRTACGPEKEVSHHA